MSRYHHAIHIPVFPSQVSGYSTLSGALTPGPAPFVSSRRRRVPQGVCKTSGGPMCPPISFDYIGHTGQGVSLADFSARSQNALAQMVAGANDQVIAGTGIKSIRLQVMWTGYEHMNANYSIPAVPAMSRGQLGASIAMQFWSFVDNANKTTTSNPQWQISPTGIRFDKILIVALYHIGDDVWQADVAVDF